jgi:hypothetical protein
VAVVFGGLVGTAEGVAVDRELLILVDVTKSVSDTDFGLMMSGYADAFESDSVIAAVESGDLGSIAVSLVFYSDKNNQAVGLGWMEISDGTGAEAFADQLRDLGRPFKKNKGSIAGALDYAVPLFGTETGGPANGFESGSQAITMAADGVDDSSKKTGKSRDATVAAARDAALATGVDVIDALTVGAAGSVDDYFVNFVVGGSLDGIPGGVENVADYSEFGAAAAGRITTIVPEPAVGMALLMGVGLWGWRRNRTQSGS